MRTQTMAGKALALAAIALIGIPGAWGADLGTAPLMQVSGSSPFAGCDVSSQTGTGTIYRNSEVEPLIVVDPNDPRHLVGAWQQDRWSNGGANGLMAGVSTNGGTTWTGVAIPRITRCSGAADYQRASDSWLSFAPNGHLYHSALVFNDSDWTSAILVSKSEDGGATWSDPVTLIRDTSPTVFNDKETITADPHDPRYVYAVWDRLIFPTQRARGRAPERAIGYRAPIMFSRSTDGGLTWEPARVIYRPDGFDQTIANQIVVLPSGDLVNLTNLMFIHKNSHKVRGMNAAIMRSRDKGATWSEPKIIDQIQSVGVTDPQSGLPVRTGDIIPMITAGPEGNLYVVWQDARFHGYDEIAFAMSTDGGDTWSPAIRINKTINSAQAFTPSIAVNLAGTVAVTYDDFRYNDTGPDLKTDHFVVHCHAGCSDPLNWTETRITRSSFDMARAPNAGGFFVGDYEGLATDGHDFFTLFSQPHAGDDASVFVGRLMP